VLLASCLQLGLTGPAGVIYEHADEIYEVAARQADRLHVELRQARFQSNDKRIFATTYDDRYAGLLMVPNLASLFELNDVAGYDPLHLGAYKRFIAVAEGKGPVRYPDRDRYHHALPHAAGRSPLMDLLNVELRLHRGRHRGIRMRRHNFAMPRGWLVTEAAVAPDPDLAARWVHDGLVDAARVVVLDGEDPELERGLPEASGTSAPRLSVRGSDWSVGAYAGVYREDHRQGAVGEGLNLVVLDPQQRGGTAAFAIRSGDDGRLSQAIEQLEREWPPGTRVALFSAGGFAVGHQPSTTADLARLGVGDDLIELLEASTLPLAVAGLGAVGAQAGEARVAWGVQVARVDEPVLGPVVFGLVSGAAADRPPKVRVRWRRDPDRISGRVSSARGGVLVVSEVGGPGWSGRLDDGPEHPLLRAYGLLPALRVPAGRHRFELRYRAPGLTAGAALSLAGLGALLLLYGLDRRRRAPAKP
jgi:hypothetical protein